MNRLNPITEDYKLLLVFRNMGTQVLQQVRKIMQEPIYSSLFRNLVLTEQNELCFTYLDHSFKTVIELYFNHTKMPKSAFLTTYYHSENKKDREEIIRYGLDLDYSINNIYTINNFAEFYLIEFHQNVKKSFSDNHTPFSIRISGK
jgi:hypothetical protein